MKYVYVLCFAILTFSPAYATDENGYENFQNRQKDWLAKDIKEADFAAILKPISYFILEEDLPEIESCTYYNHITVYKVVETYKGDLPGYILMKGFSEYCKKYEGERYGTMNEGTIIRAFCKGSNHYYFPSTHYLYKDTQLLRKIAKQSSKTEESEFQNKCNKEHWLSK